MNLRSCFLCKTYWNRNLGSVPLESLNWPFSALFILTNTSLSVHFRPCAPAPVSKREGVVLGSQAIHQLIPGSDKAIAEVVLGDSRPRGDTVCPFRVGVMLGAGGCSLGMSSVFVNGPYLMDVLNNRLCPDHCFLVVKTGEIHGLCCRHEKPKL